MLAHWEDGPGDEHIAWARQFGEAIEAFAEGGGGAYVNNLDNEDEARVRARNGDNYERLA